VGISYIKLMSGEEIIGNVEEQTDVAILVVTHPLAMESDVDVSDPTRRFVYMSRFAPYAADPKFTMPMTAVAFVVPVAQHVVRYYEISLRYCERFTDPSFMDTMNETSDQIEDTMRGGVTADELTLRMHASVPISNSVN